MLNHLLQDLRYGIRMLLAKPGFTLAAVLTLALGIGANTAVFSVINALLLKPLPYADSERLVDIYNTYPRNGVLNGGDSIPDYLDRREQASALEDSALYHAQSYNLSLQGAPQRLNGTLATPSLFSTLGVSATLGRALVEDDAKAGNDHVAVLSFPLWKNGFGGDRGIIGRDVTMNGANYRIVGVMPENFFFADRQAQLWTPFAFTEEQRSDKQRGWEFSNMVGRLKPGATIAQLEAQMNAIIHRNIERLSVSNEGTGDESKTFALAWKRFVEAAGFTGRARSLRDAWVGDLRPTLWLLQVLVGCVLLIACANVANLMLSRLSSRQKELSVRSALGAGGGRVARQLLAESLLLAIAGGGAGLVLAGLGVALIRDLGLGDTTASFTIGIDASVLTFSFALAVGTAFAFGLLPVLSLARGRPFEALKEGGRGNSAGIASRALRNALVVVQISMAVALLVISGLLLRSFVQIQQASPGFSSENVLSASIDLAEDRYADDAKKVQFYEQLLGAVRALPGVTSAGLVNNMPFSGNNAQSSYAIEGHDAKNGEAMPHGFAQMVDEDFFKSLQVPILQGRSFNNGDTRDAMKVAIVDELLAKKYFPNESPLGKRINNRDPSKTGWLTIVGVAGVVKRERLSEQTTKETIYVYYKQFPESHVTLAVKTTLAPSALIAPLRDALQRIDPEQPVFDIKTMSERIAQSLDDRRTPMLLLMLFAGVALALSAIGIYGVLAFAVALRTGEIGVRLSLGAQRRDILRLILGDGGRLTALGLFLGLIGAVAIASAMRAQLFGIGVVDPLTLAGVIALLAVTAFVACWLPARRASRVDPIEALRHE
jgi:predicted permease